MIDLNIRKEKGENVDLAIYNKTVKKSEYENALLDLKDKILKEQSLNMGMPRLKGIVRIIPAESVPESMQTSQEIERIGMEIAMHYEIKNNRIPEDVSAENLGFDIRSKSQDGKVRYIEVKARAGIAAVALTQNEWFKAMRFANDYYLYAVLNARNTPELHVVQNPAEKFKPLEQFEVVRYIVPAEEIRNSGVRGSEVGIGRSG